MELVSLKLKKTQTSCQFDGCSSLNAACSYLYVRQRESLQFTSSRDHRKHEKFHFARQPRYISLLYHVRQFLAQSFISVVLLTFPRKEIAFLLIRKQLLLLIDANPFFISFLQCYIIKLRVFFKFVIVIYKKKMEIFSF